jgi:hypothetical protein
VKRKPNGAKQKDEKKKETKFMLEFFKNKPPGCGIAKQNGVKDPYWKGWLNDYEEQCKRHPKYKGKKYPF